MNEYGTGMGQGGEDRGAEVPGGGDGGMRDEMEHRLQARLGAMEREVRALRSRSRLLGVGLLAALVVGGLAMVRPDLMGLVVGPRGPEVIEARGLVLVDADGTPRGEWRVDDEGNASLSLLDRQQRPRLTLTVRSEGFPGLSLSNAAGERRVALGLLPDETTSLVFADGAGVPRAVLGLVRGDAANLVFADAEGVSRIGFGLDGTGLGSVMLPDEEADPDSGGGDS